MTIDVGDKIFFPITGATVEIIKDYGWQTPIKDYPDYMWRCDLSGWVLCKNIETGDIFPATRNELKEAIEKNENIDKEGIK